MMPKGVMDGSLMEFGVNGARVEEISRNAAQRRLRAETVGHFTGRVWEKAHDVIQITD